MIQAKILALLVLLGLVFRLTVSRTIYSGDLNNHIGWSRSIMMEGGRGAYDREYTGIMQPTYPPLALNAFATSYWAYSGIYSVSRWANNKWPVFPSKFIWWLEDQNTLPAFEKVIGIVSDLGIGVLIYLLARTLGVSKNKSLLSAGIYIFNPAVWYNSTLWGQIESFPLFWLLLSVWLLYRSKWQWAHLAFMAALLSKQSTIIFIPFFALFSLKTIGWKKTFLGGLLQLLFFYVAYLPFFNTGDILWPFKVYINRIQTGSGSNYVTDHAFNIWALYTKLQKIADSQIVWKNLTTQMVGMSGFVIGILLLIPKLVKKIQLKNLLSSMGLTSLLAFLLLTRMHERYLASALPFLAVLTATSPIYAGMYALVSFGNLINMYHNWWVPTISSWVVWTSLWSTISVVAISLTVVSVVWMLKYCYDKK